MRYSAIQSDALVLGLLEKLEKWPHQWMFPIAYPNGVYGGFITRDDILNFQKRFPDRNDARAIDILVWALIECGLPRNIHVHSRDPLDMAYEILLANKLQFVPVVERDGTFLGTIDVEVFVKYL